MIDPRDAAEYVIAVATVITVAAVRPWRWWTDRRARAHRAMDLATSTAITTALVPLTQQVDHIAARQDWHIEDHKSGDARLCRLEDRLERVEDRQIDIAGAIGVTHRLHDSQPDDPDPSD